MTLAIDKVPHCTSMTEVRAGVNALDDVLVPLLVQRSGYMTQAARVKNDDALVRDGYARLLQLWGGEARVPANADPVLAALGQGGWRPHLIVTDHRLGGALNGRQLIDALRRQAVKDGMRPLRMAGALRVASR